jgi:hypothetical protein
MRSDRHFRFAGPSLVAVAVLTAGLPLVSAPLATPGAAAPVLAESPAAHPLKLSHGRLDVEGDRMTVRVRMFWDDLEEAIRYMTEDRRFRIGHTAEADSLVGRYLGSVLILNADGTRPTGRVIDSGEEDDMFWYIVEYRAGTPIRSLTFRNEIMVDLYPEQRNVLQVRNTARNVNRTFYFSSKKEEYTLNF